MDGQVRGTAGGWGDLGGRGWAIFGDTKAAEHYGRANRADRHHAMTGNRHFRDGWCGTLRTGNYASAGTNFNEADAKGSRCRLVASEL